MQVLFSELQMSSFQLKITIDPAFFRRTKSAGTLDFIGFLLTWHYNNTLPCILHRKNNILSSTLRTDGNGSAFRLFADSIFPSIIEFLCNLLYNIIIWNRIIYPGKAYMTRTKKWGNRYENRKETSTERNNRTAMIAHFSDVTVMSVFWILQALSKVQPWAFVLIALLLGYAPVIAEYYFSRRHTKPKRSSICVRSVLQSTTPSHYSLQPTIRFFYLSFRCS